MSNIYKGEMQDYEGNTVYPHTEADIVFCADGTTAQSKLNKYENALGSVTGKTDSLDVSDSNVLATAKAVNTLKSSLEETKKSVSDGKTLVANAITAKGVSTSASATFATMANNIGNIQTDVQHTATISFAFHESNGTNARIAVYVDGVMKSTSEHRNWGTTTNSKLPSSFTITL
jgi:hypothetical protein